MTAHEAWILSALETAGTPLLFLTLTLETLGLPAPGETALIAAATAAGAGKLSIVKVVLAAWAGAVLGDNIGYLLGRRFGRSIVIGYGDRVGITEARYQWVEAQFDRYGAWAVCIARFVVILRQLNGLVAGTAGMAWSRFFLANVVGAFIWVGVWSALAYHLGDVAHLVPDLWHHLARVAWILIPSLLLVGGALYLHLQRRRR